MEYMSHSPEETEHIGEMLGKRLSGGTVLALRGGLGMGKTAFTRGLARGLGYTGRVTSPTFTIVNEYDGATPCSISICTGWTARTTCSTSAGTTIWPGAACAPWSGQSASTAPCRRTRSPCPSPGASTTTTASSP